MIRSLLGGLVLIAATTGLAQAQNSTQDHQYSTADIEAGARLYAGQCSLCHGPNGESVAGVDLRRGQFRRSVSDEDLARVIVGRRRSASDAGPINNWTDEVGNGAVMAIDPQTGQVRWKAKQFDVTDGGMLTTASDLLFTGGREGYFHAIDARDGKLLWKASLGGQIVMAPITFQVDGKQYVSVISGHTLVTFGLRD